MGYRIGKYVKYVYWLPKAEVGNIAEALKEQGVEPYVAKKAVCVPLSRRVEVGIVSPDTWEKFELCKRQLSWYRYSAHRDEMLVVASKRLKAGTVKPHLIIKDTRFRPPALPGKEEQFRLIEQESYRIARPEEWENIHDEDPKLHERWLKIMGLRGLTYEELFVTHCANHANFIEPLFYITEGAEKIPYSIAKTSHICSACLEFYGIIGERFKKKLIVPCPGAVLFAGLAPNRYYEVTREEGVRC